MPFDPNAYLQGGGGFDPNSYLADAKPAFDPKSYLTGGAVPDNNPMFSPGSVPKAISGPPINEQANPQNNPSAYEGYNLPFRAMDYLKGNTEANWTLGKQLLTVPAGALLGAVTGTGIEHGMEKGAEIAGTPSTETGRKLLESAAPGFDILNALGGHFMIGHGEGIKASPRLVEKLKEVKPTADEIIQQHNAQVDPFWQQRAEGMAADAATGDRLQAAVDRQNPQQPTIHIDSNGKAVLPEDIPGRTSAEDAAAQQRYAAAQQIIEQRQSAQEIPVAQQASLLTNATERARQENAPVPGIENIRQTNEAARQPGFMQEPAVTEQPSMFNRGMGRRQGGGMNMSLLDPAFEQVKELANGIKLRLIGREEGPIIVADDTNGKRLGAVKFSPDTWANPTENSNLFALHVSSHYPNLAKEMYQFAAETGNDIVPSKIQTGKGADMWKRFEQQGLAQGNKIKSGPQPRDLSATARDLSTHDKLDPVAQQAAQTAARDINRGPGGRQRGVMMVPGESKPPKVETKTEPRSPENVAKKQELEKKARAVDLYGTQYEQVKTIEDAKTNPGPDMGAGQVGNVRLGGTRDRLASGVTGQIYRNTTNRVLKYARYLATTGREAAEAFSTKFVTGKDGVNVAYRKLKSGEWSQVAEALIAGSRNKTELTPELMTKLGLNDRQQAMVGKVYDALKEMYRIGNKALTDQGLKEINYHPGYVPSMFSGAFTSLVHSGNKLLAVVQADTKWGHSQGKKFFEGKDVKISDLPRKGLRTSNTYSRTFDGFNDVVSQLAKDNPDFAKLKAEVDAHIAGQTHKLFNFDVHEKAKTGVTGSLGDRPWLDKETNGKQFLEGMINYLEEGSRYYSYQTPVNKLGELLADPELRDSHPNTIKYLDMYSKHLQGHDLNIAGAFMNSVVDFAFEAAGLSPKAASASIDKVRGAMSAHMMGLYNPAFFGMQLTQYYTGGLPEALAIREATGLSAADFAGAWTHATMQTAALAAEELTGKKIGSIDQHMRDAMAYAREQGMMHFSEAELSHDVLSSPTTKAVKAAANIPIKYGEMLTRPAIFMWYADLFKRAGMEGEDLHRVAKDATDYAMANYHPDERPLIYSQLGYVGKMLGALTTFKHNLLEQFISRGSNVTGAPAAAASMVGMAYLLYGVSGLPGYQEADKIVQYLTGKNIRRWFDETPTTAKNFWDGVVSTSTGLDFQTRLSMASVVPDSVAGAIASPQLANAFDIMVKAYKYARDQDTASRNQFLMAATPQGLKGYTESKLQMSQPQVPYAEGHVLDKEGQHKYEEPRTELQQTVRKASSIRPISERLTDEDVHSRDLQYKDMTDKQKEQQKRLAAAINYGDKPAQDDAIKQFLAEGGDPQQISDHRIRQIVIDASVSSRQRRSLAPQGNIGSVNKYREYHE